MRNENGNTTVRLGDYFILLRRQWLVVLLCLVLGLGAALAYLQWAPKEYRSTTSVLVTAMQTDSTAAVDTRVVINLDTEAQLVTSTETVALATENLGLPPTEARVTADRVGVSVPPNTEILDVTYVGSTAAEAQRGSLAFAEAYLEQRRATGESILANQETALQERIDVVTGELNRVLQEAARLPEDSAARARADDQASRLSTQLSTLSSNQNRIRSESLTPGRIVAEPRLPSSPSSPDPLIAVAAGLLLGALLGVGIAALRHRADDLIRTPDDLFRRTRVPVAAVLATRLHAGEVALLPPLSADGRGYARLRNLVTTSLEESDRRVVLVAGVRRGGGPVAANLAASLARSGEDVFLVCADVFGPTASSLLDDPVVPGLAEVLAGDETLDAVTRRVRSIPNLRVLGPGRDPDRADALLQTRGPRKLIDDLLVTASYVVIEAPPTTDSPDAQTLANVADLAVLAVEAGQCTAREVVDAVAQLESMRAAVLGAVVTRYGRDSDPDRPRPARERPTEDDDAPREDASLARDDSAVLPSAPGTTDDTAHDTVDVTVEAHPVAEESAAEESATTESATTESATTESATTESATTESATTAPTAPPVPSLPPRPQQVLDGGTATRPAATPADAPDDATPAVHRPKLVPPRATGSAPR